MHELHQNALVWDAHVCFPLNPNAELEQLRRYRASGIDFVSINVGMDMDAFEKIMQVLAGFRRYLAARADDYVLVETAADVSAAKVAGKLAVAFDLEGSDPLLGNVNLISLYYDLGVRQMLLAYNKDNQAAGGCMEGEIGLTAYGEEVIAEMNRVGMLVDLSHMGHQATLDACAYSTAPVIFSHSNPSGVRQHARNISDEQIRACAATGGVIGINGIGDFLGDTTSATVVAHIEYVMSLVGPGHVGLGLDYVVDKQELIAYITNHPDIFPPDKIQNYLAFVEPEQTAEITQLLVARGHSEAVVRGILGGNFLRVAEAVWQ